MGPTARLLKETLSAALKTMTLKKHFQNLFNVCVSPKAQDN